MLYALPDHEVMDQLLPEIRSNAVPVETAVELINNNIGYVPVAIDPANEGSIYFVNIGDTPFLEWKYIYTIERLAKEGAITEMFTTDFSVLDRDDLKIDALSPDGFIFHVSRCGSTLFTKALSLSPKNIVINQGGPLQEGFWKIITKNWAQAPEPSDENLRRFRHLVLLMTRKRQPQYERSFVKFISWNIIYIDFVRIAFPEACPLYLYRNPLEVIAVVLQETTAVLRSKGQLLAGSLTGLKPEKTAVMTDTEYLSQCYAHYFDTALGNAAGAGLRFVNYEQLRNREAFSDIVSQGFKLDLEDEELLIMLNQYQYYSKDDTYSTVYTGENEDLTEILGKKDQEIISKICNKRLINLNQSEYNIFPSSQ